jgi:O-antigen/teichoic acid export membrane protein
MWMLGLRMSERLLGVIRTLILARLLSTEAFGIMGVTLLAMSTLETFSQTGFEIALIQKQEDIRSYLDTAWTLQLIRGFLLFLVLIITAPLIAYFFESPESAMVIRAMSIIELLKGVTNIGVIYFQRSLDFNKQFTYQFSATVMNLVTATVAALIWRNVWALVLGLLIGQITRCFLSFVKQSYRPKLYIDWQKAREMFGFGSWVLATNIVVFLAVNGDDFLLGKLLGVATLGLYQMAFRFANLATTDITRVISQVTLPAYAKLQSDTTKLRLAFLKTLEAVISITVPIFAIIFFLGFDFTRIFLGEEWMPMVTGMQILSVSGVIRAIIATGGPLFNAVSQPKLNFQMNFIRMSVMVIMVFPLTKRWGLLGASTAVLIGTVSGIPVWWYNSLQVIEGKTSTFCMQLLYMMALLLPMGIPVLILKPLLGYIGILEFFVLTLLMLSGYLLLALLLWKFWCRGPVKTIKEVVLSV